MYWCNECKAAFEEPKEIDTGHFEDCVDDCRRIEWVGGTSQRCPNCESDDYDRAFICTHCGEYCGELHGYGDNKICGDCLSEGATVDNLIEFGDYADYINDFFTAFFDDEEINRLLAKRIRELQEIGFSSRKNSYIDRYIESNKNSLAYWLVKKGKLKEL